MSISDRLDEIEARASRATAGPWRASLLDGVEHEDGSSGYRGGIYPGTVPGPPPVLITPNVDRRDAAFIAAARTDVHALVAALRAVLDLHKRVANTGVCHTEGCPCTLPEWTCTCQLERHDEYSPWPCPTVRAVQAALGEVQP